MHGHSDPKIRNQARKSEVPPLFLCFDITEGIASAVGRALSTDRSMRNVVSRANKLAAICARTEHGN